MQRSLILTSGLVVALSIGLSGCGVFGVRGSGDLITESRDVAGFDEIILEGSGTVLVSVTGEESLDIEAEDNLMPLLTSEVEDGRLILGSREAISPTRGIRYMVTVASLSGLSIQGSGEIDVFGVEADTLEVVISGSGEMVLTDMTVGDFLVRISGSGDLIAAGSAADLNITVSGSGAYAGEDLLSGTATVVVSGSGNVVVNASDRLDAAVSGSGDIEYLGDPIVDSTISGSGDVRRR